MNIIFLLSSLSITWKFMDRRKTRSFLIMQSEMTKDVDLVKCAFNCKI